MLSDDTYQAFQLEFIDAADDGLDRIEKTVESVFRRAMSPAEALQAIRREVHLLKGQGAAFGFPVVTAILNRLEDYLRDEEEVSDDLSLILNKFFDPVRQILREGKDPEESAGPALLRGLPVRHMAVDISVEQVDVEVLIGVPSSVNARIVRQILNNCGFRVMRSVNFMDTFTTAIRSRPDAIIVSQTLDELTGVDLARGLRAMSPNRFVPIAILTSFDPANAAFKGLPSDIIIIRVGKDHFDDDMATFLTKIDVNRK